MLAASWFTLAGFDVSWPLEPARYDLIAIKADRQRKVQVKTTAGSRRHGRQVWLSTTSRGPRTLYGTDEIDEFFVIDAALNFYRIPVQIVGGRHAITLDGYEACRVTSFSDTGALACDM